MKYLALPLLSLGLGAPLLAGAPALDLQDPAPAARPQERQRPEKAKEKDNHARRAERAHDEKVERRVATGKIDPAERELAREESDYRMRKARLERMRQIYQERGDQEKVARIDELLRKNEALKEKRVDRLRRVHGDEKVEAARARMRERVGRLDEEQRRERAERIRSQKDQKGESIKGRDPREVRERRGATPRNERKRRGGGGR